MICISLVSVVVALFTQGSAAPTAATVPGLSDGLNFKFPKTTKPVPWKISVDRAFIEITKLKAKLYRPNREVMGLSDWEDGIPTATIKSVAKYWANEYDWFAIEKQINTNFSNFATVVQGGAEYPHPVPLHFVHHQSKRADATPLLLLHGWPSSFLLFADMIKGLVDPPKKSDPAFHVIIPSVPGFGFSPAAEYPGYGIEAMAKTFDALMLQLEYPKYAIYTTDLGSFVGTAMLGSPTISSHLTAHVTDFYLVFATPEDLARYAANQTTAEETTYISAINAYGSQNAGYAGIHSTRPLSIAIAMTDSPVGYAGWIAQLEHAFGDGHVYSEEELITNTMMLWIQGSYGNMRTYKTFPPVSIWISDTMKKTLLT